MPSSVDSHCTLPNAQDSVDAEKPGAESALFPDGGTAAWCTVIGAALVQFCGFGYTSSFGVYQDFYTLHYLAKTTPSAISWIGSMNTFLVTSLGVATGMLYDRGYLYYLLIGGSLLQSFTMFMLSLARPGQYYQIFLAQGISLGIGQGLLYVPAIAVVSHHFSKRRTLAMSLTTAGSSLGSIVHTIMLNSLFNGRIGFANGVRISAAFVSVLLLASCLLLRTRLELPKRPANYISVGRSIISDVPFCILIVALLVFNIGFQFPVFYLQLDAVKHKSSQTFSFYSLVLLNGGTMIGRLSTGFIAPRIGALRLMIITTGICGILSLGMIGLSNIPSIVILGIVYGYFAGIYIALIAPLMALLTSNLSELGTRMGIGIMVSGIGALVGGPISGALLTSQYKWWQPSLFSGLVSFAGCSLFLLLQLTLTRQQHSAENKQDCDQGVSQEVEK